jgi:hypothetical protein
MSFTLGLTATALRLFGAEAGFLVRLSRIANR